LPLIESAYHAGDGGQGIGNRQSIGIEICVNADGNFEQAKKNAQELIRWLLNERHISINYVVQHNHWSGKNCPRTMRETNTWKPFIDGIQKVEVKPMAKSHVEDWQRFVNSKGGKLEVDGSFGPATLAASTALVNARDVEIAALKKSVATLQASLQTANTNTIALTADKKSLTSRLAQIKTIASI
jgi:hypothetical protein